jgi:CO/xanthine dehydrogenase Mo-binding subunit
MSRLDQGLPRPDAAAKAMGRSRYLPDMKVEGMLHGFIVSSPIACGIIKSIDISKAEKMEGVEVIITHETLPGYNNIGLLFTDQPLLVEDRVRMVGDRIALVAADTFEHAKAAAAAVVVDIEPTDGVYDVTTALNAETPLIHEKTNMFKEFHVKRGNIDQSIISSDIVINEEYLIGGQEHAYLETQGTMAVPQPDDSWEIFTSTQCPFYVRARVSKMLGLPQNQVRVIQTVTGGAFGGKEDYPDEPAMCAAALAKATRKPVKLVFPRDYDMQASTKRHSMVIRHKLYASKDGVIAGVKVEVLVDSGAYAGLSTIVAERANISSVGPYDIPNIEVNTKCIYTNNLFGGPYRGFGAPQVSAAHESQIDKLAKIVGKDPFEIRRLNGFSKEKCHFASGEKLAQPHIYGEVLDKLEELSNWKATKKEIETSDKSRWLEGIGVGTMIYGVNLHHGGQRLDRGAAYAIILNDGSISLSVGITEMGQGTFAAMRTICAASLGVSEKIIRISEVDTAMIPDSGPTVASRGTMSGGRAVVAAAKILNSRLRPIAMSLLGVDNTEKLTVENGIYSHPDSAKDKPVTFKAVVDKLYADRINPAAIGWYRSEKRDYDPKTGQGRAYAFYAFGGHVVKVKVDRDTGQVKVVEVTAVHDVGQVINLAGIQGQVQGGTVQGIGWAIMEKLTLKNGKMLNSGFTDYLIPSSMDIPEVLRMDFIEEPEERGPFGAKGIGEPSFISVGAAIVNAVAHATGKDVNTLPLLPETIYNIMKEND